jgi:hypothetical protein
MVKSGKTGIGNKWKYHNVNNWKNGNKWYIFGMPPKRK